MKARPSPSSSSAMAVLLEAAGSSRISPALSSPCASLCDRPGPVVMEYLLEEIPTEEVLGVRAGHVRSDMNHDIPGAARGWIGGLHGALDVRRALVVCNHGVEGVLDRPTRGAAPEMDVRDVYRGSLETGDLELDGERGWRGGDRDRALGSRRTDPVQLENERSRRWRRGRRGDHRARRRRGRSACAGAAAGGRHQDRGQHDRPRHKWKPSSTLYTGVTGEGYLTCSRSQSNSAAKWKGPPESRERGGRSPPREARGWRGGLCVLDGWPARPARAPPQEVAEPEQDQDRSDRAEAGDDVVDGGD